MSGINSYDSSYGIGYMGGCDAASSSESEGFEGLSGNQGEGGDALTMEPDEVYMGNGSPPSVYRLNDPDLNVSCDDLVTQDSTDPIPGLEGFKLFQNTDEIMLSDGNLSAELLQVKYDALKAHLMNGEPMSNEISSALEDVATLGGNAEQVQDLLDVGGINNARHVDGDVTGEARDRLNQLLTSSDPDVSALARNMIANPPIPAPESTQFTSPLPPRADDRYKAYSQQDGYQMRLLGTSLKSDPQVMDALQNFSSLSLEDKLDLAQTIVKKQAAIYGAEPAPIFFDPLSAPNEYGAYMPAAKKIRVGALALADPSEFVNTLTHEQSHAYQNQLAGNLSAGKPVDAKVFNTAFEWRDNIKHYISAPTAAEANDADLYAAKYKAYSDQPIEKHAFDTGDTVARDVMWEVKG